jgi:NAD(P)-dependent dehydrogenase (short-subunit alcohol dehydrogenase family)
MAAMAATNGSVSTLATALAVELAPTRVNAISPGVITTSAWDVAVPDKKQLFQRVAATAPALGLTTAPATGASHRRQRTTSSQVEPVSRCCPG